MGAPPDERKDVVRRGYDQMGTAYLAARPDDRADVALLADLHHRLPPGARVLDAGCGAGIPVAQRLVEAGYRVVGLDFSMAQLALARSHVPAASPVQADMATLSLGTATFDGLVSYYAIIHVPREDHPAVLSEFRRVLRRGGWALLCLGLDDNPDDHDEESWLGAPMYWSHYDAATSTRLVAQGGFRIVRGVDIPDPMAHGAHRFVLARAA